MVAPSRSQPKANSRLAVLLSGLSRNEGFTTSCLPGVHFMRSTRHVPSTPTAYEPCIVIIAQGQKRGRVGDKVFTYDPNNYLVLAVPLPFECETFGTPTEPLLGLSVAIPPGIVADLVVQMKLDALDVSTQPEAADAAELDDSLTDAAGRLLECLRNDEDARVLGPSLVREIIYRVLRGPLGPNLRALAAPDGHFGQISRVLNRIHANFSQAFEVEALAREAGMSVSTFHAHFKAMTASSPLQYLKSIRLHKARMLMVHDGVTAAYAASQVGYESASQFSREFKRLFGDAPGIVASQLRAQLMRFVDSR